MTSKQLDEICYVTMAFDVIRSLIYWSMNIISFVMKSCIYLLASGEQYRIVNIFIIGFPDFHTLSNTIFQREITSTHKKG